jgi:hypothetical protein
MTAQRILIAPGACAPDEHLTLDLASLRVLEVPEVAPPFDPEVLPNDVDSARGQAPAAVPRPRGGKEGPAPAVCSDTAGTRSRAGDRAAGDRGTGDAAICDPAAAGGVARDDWPQRFAGMLVETLAGARPLRQIVPWTTGRSRSHIRKIAPTVRAGARPRVLRVLTSHPGPGVVEMTVIVRIGPRIRALAVRLEQAARTGQPAQPGNCQPGKWLCTDIEAA